MSSVPTRSPDRTVQAAPRTRGPRPAATFAALAALVVLIGGVAGAHLALTLTPGPAAAVPLITSAPPLGGTGLARAFEFPLAPEAADPHESELARLYEEALEESLTPEATADPVRLASLPARPEIPALVPVRRPPLWLRNAVSAAVRPGQPMIAIVIDDLGLNRPAARRAIALPAPLTLSFMTYAQDLPRFAEDAHDAGHELMLHVPMEPRNGAYDAGPKVLRVGLSRDEIAERLAWGLNRFEGFVGINNHMGSRFTASPEGMAEVMRELHARDLLFLDSVTSSGSIAGRAAARAGVPFARRDVFLDHDRRDPGAILEQLEVLERIARQRGYAVGIGHPHTATLEVLAHWLPDARRRGIALVPITAIVGHRFEVVQSANGRAG